MSDERHDGNYRNRFDPGTDRPAKSQAAYASQAAAGYSDSSDTEGTEQLEVILDILVRRRLGIAMIFAVIVGLVGAFTFLRTPLYRATSYVMVDLGASGPIGGELAAMGQLTGNRAGGGRTLKTELFVLQASGKIYDRVLRRLIDMQGIDPSEFDIEQMTAEANRSSETATFPIGEASFTAASAEVENVIAVSAVSASASDAALLANIYSEEYVRLTQEASRASLSTRRSFLEDQESQMREELRSAEEAVKAYTTRNRTVGLDQETTNLVNQIATLEANRDEAQIELSIRRSSLAAGEKELEDINPKLVQRFSSGVDRRMTQVEEALTTVEQEKNTILLANSGMSDDDPALAEKNREIESLNVELRDLAQQFVDEVSAAGGIPGSEANLEYIAELKRNNIQDRIEIEGLESRISMMDDQLRDYQAELNNIPELSLELARLERTRQHADQLYQAVVSQLQEARIAEESKPGYANVIREAEEPLDPFAPNPVRNFTLAIFFGLMLGLGWAVMRDKLDNRLYKPEQLTRKGRAVTGIIPNMQKLLKEEFGGEKFARTDSGSRFSTQLVSLLSPMSSVSEAYRAVRTAIQFSLPDSVVQTLLVTSPGAGEGKSTSAANLAILMAQSGRKTLLIDADLRRPQVHRLLGRKNRPGLVQLLFQNDEDVDIDAFATEIDNLYVLTAGTVSKKPDGTKKEISAGRNAVVSNPAELLGSKRMRDLLHSLRNEFDSIIIDTPPVLAGTDAALLSTQSDASLVVVRAGQTREGELDYAWNALSDVGARLIGTLFNGFDVSMAYGYKYRYGNHAQYGYYANYGHPEHEIA